MKVYLVVFYDTYIYNNIRRKTVFLYFCYTFICIFMFSALCVSVCVVNSISSGCA